MWHASGRAVSGSRFATRRIVRHALAGVGDAAAGEWVEEGGRGTLHLRRRLSVAEAALVGVVRDIRGTAEERERIASLLAAVSPRTRSLLRSLLGGLR